MLSIFVTLVGFTVPTIGEEIKYQPFASEEYPVILLEAEYVTLMVTFAAGMVSVGLLVVGFASEPDVTEYL